MRIFKRILRFIVKSVLTLVALILVVLLVAILTSKHDFGTPSEPLGTGAEHVSISNVNVIDVTTESKSNDTVVVRNVHVLMDNGIITEIIPDSLDVPKGYMNIDGAGGYVIPGLIDMHTHIFDRSDLAMYLGHGVTSVRNMMGFPMHLRWKQQIESSEYPGSRLITASPTINSGNNTGPFHKNIKTLGEASDAIAEYKEKGYDFIKIYDGLNYEQFVHIMQEAENHGFYVAGHPPHGLEVDTLLAYPMNSIEHVEEIVQGPLHYELDTIIGRKIAQKFKETDSRLTITLSPFRHIYGTTTEGESYLETLPKDKINPFIAFIGGKQLGQWVNCSKGTYDWNVAKYACMEQLTKIFYEEEVEVLLGTDTGPNLTVPGITLLEEIELLHELGIPSLEILKSGTIKAAKALQMDNQIGSVAVGKNAELLLLEKNPLQNIETLRRPKAIISKGLVYQKPDIEVLKELGRDKSNSYLTIGRFLNHVLTK